MNWPQKVKELVRLAQEQGYLTYDDINEALPDSIATPEEIEEILLKLRNLEVEIVDQAEVDRVKQPEPEEEEEKSRLDILDDPVRMYLKQMGQVPLLTREQEVEISKRIETAENEVKPIIYSFGFAGKEHIALAEKLVSEPPKERFDRVILDKKIDGRDSHLKALAQADQERSASSTSKWMRNMPPGRARRQGRARQSCLATFKKLDKKLQETFAEILLQAKGHRGDGAGGGEHPRQIPDRACGTIQDLEAPAQIRAAAADHRVRAAQDPGAGGICAHAATQEYLEGLSRS